MGIQGIVDQLKIWFEFIKSSAVESVGVSMIFAIFAILLVVNDLFGYKLMRFWGLIAGMFIGAVIGLVCDWGLGQLGLEAVQKISPFLLAADIIVFAFLGVKYYKFGIFLITAPAVYIVVSYFIPDDMLLLSVIVSILAGTFITIFDKAKAIPIFLISFISSFTASYCTIVALGWAENNPLQGTGISLNLIWILSSIALITLGLICQYKLNNIGISEFGSRRGQNTDYSRGDDYNYSDDVDKLYRKPKKQRQRAIKPPDHFESMNRQEQNNRSNMNNAEAAAYAAGVAAAFQQMQQNNQPPMQQGYGNDQQGYGNNTGYNNWGEQQIQNQNQVNQAWNQNQTSQSGFVGQQDNQDWVTQQDGQNNQNWQTEHNNQFNAPLDDQQNFNENMYESQKQENNGYINMNNTDNTGEQSDQDEEFVANSDPNYSGFDPFGFDDSSTTNN